MIVFGLIISFIFCTVYFLVEAVRNGMAKKRWVTVGIVLGPMALPMFQVSKKMAIRKIIGYDSVFFSA
jgi:hypothetical protein